VCVKSLEKFEVVNYKFGIHINRVSERESSVSTDI